MPVNEAGNQAPPFKVKFSGMRYRELGLGAADGNNPATTDQHITKAQVLGREDLGIAKEFQQGRGPASKKGSLYYTTEPTPNRLSAAKR
jgi:hypothetical protein